MEVQSTVLTCCHRGCGIVFAVPSWWQQKRREDHTSFYCPNGHQQSFSSESDEEKFRRERDIARQQLARLEDENRTALAAAEKARKETKRLKKRAAAGACPCCHRSFSNMTEHMKKQHPKFVAAEIANVIPLKKRTTA